MRVSAILLVVVVLLGLSSVMGAHRLKSKLAAKSMAKADGNSCTYLGETQQCSVWCTENCGAPCSSCESQSGNVCACDDVPAINTKTLAKADGNSCTYLGATQQCSVWCTENCGAPCSSCESQSGNECACDDVPAINTKKAAVWVRDPVGNSCSYLGETQQCSEWCTSTCGAPCSTCAEGSNDVVCACDEIPAISDIKTSPLEANNNNMKTSPLEANNNNKVWIKAATEQGYSCSYLGETQDCATWCTNTCGAPCSTCFGSEDNNNVCECDTIPAISDIKTSPLEANNNNVWVRDPVGNSCSYLGETQECSEWCTNTCGAPCSSCEAGSNDVVCSCDEVPALNDKVLVADPAGNSCTYLGETQECSVWCTENCGAPCSSCESGSGNVCACDDTPAINTVKSAKWIKADGNSCSYLGVTQQCSEWCTNTCGAPCSACEIADGSVCACDDIPAINTAAAVWIRDPVGNSCSYLGETQECSEWCTNTCGAPCSSCEAGSNDVVCACDDIPAISDVAIKNGQKVSKKH
jgi:hypothetical protein